MGQHKHYLLLIVEKSLADLKTEARRGYLGLLWWIIEPVIYMSVFYLIFVVVFQRRGEDQVLFLLTGLVVWKWFSATMLGCANCITANSGLIQQVYVPKFVFPSMIVMTATVKFLIIFLLLAVFFLLFGIKPALSWLSIPVIMSVQLLFMWSAGSILAVMVPYFPDVKIIVENGLLLMFFLSGVFFDISSVSPNVKAYLYMNPMLGIIEAYREVLLDGLWPDWFLLALIIIASFILLVSGVLLLVRYDRRIAKVL